MAKWIVIIAAVWFIVFCPLLTELGLTEMRFDVGHLIVAFMALLLYKRNYLTVLWVTLAGAELLKTIVFDNMNLGLKWAMAYTLLIAGTGLGIYLLTKKK